MALDFINKIQKVAQDRFETIVGSNVKIKGNLSDDNSIEIHGGIEGEVSSEGDIIIGESAVIVGPVKAKNLDVSGAITGSITAFDKLELQPSAKITGDIIAKILSIKPGAQLNGSCQMAEGEVADGKKTKKELRMEIEE